MSTAADTLTFFRDQWASRLVDTCTVERRSLGALNPGTLTYTPTVAVQYTGPCLVRPQNGSAKDYGQESVATRDYVVMVPFGEDDVVVDDIVVVNSTHDGLLDVKELIVTNVRVDTYDTVRRFDCLDNQGAGA